MIGVLAPYREISDLAIALKREIDDPLEVVPARVMDAVVAGRRLMNAGATVLVARGGSIDALRADLGGGIPIVDIPVTAHDVLRAVASGRKKAPRVCVMAYPNMIEGIDETAEALGVEVQVVRLSRDTDIAKAILEIGNPQQMCLVGGAITCEVAKTCGFSSVLIRSGRESVVSALREASRIAKLQKTEAEKRYRLRAVLDSMEDGIIVTDAHGSPELWNAEAAKRFQAGGVQSGDAFPISALKDSIAKCVSSGFSEDVVIKLPSGAHSVASVRPVAADRKAKGVLISVRDAVRVEALENKVRRDVHTLGLTADRKMSDIIGQSEVLKETVSRAEAFALVDATVLILGESGTGKEVYAQAIHNASVRRNGPYVALNCAALPETLLESELFGYVSGAFTGATKEGKPGLFEVAHKGTLLFDEISELPTSLQGKLLRVLQERRVRRVGGDKVTPVDVRIIAASNKDLTGMVSKGRFRDDLYYRLDVLRLTVPPLRSRPEDVEIAFNHFVAEFSKELGLPAVRLTPESVNLLMTYPWPGNVREVQNAVQRCLALYGGQTLTPDKIGNVLGPDGRFAGAWQMAAQGRGVAKDTKRPTDNEIRKALEACGGSMAKAARMLGVHRTTVWRRMNRA